MTKIQLIESLSKLQAEVNSLNRRTAAAEEKATSLHGQLSWTRQLCQELLVALTAGAKEGNWPRKGGGS